MLDADWPTCDGPWRMVNGLRQASERKLRLFVVGCCRSVWPFLTDPRSRTLLTLTEQSADGTASGADWDEARRRHAHLYISGAGVVAAAAGMNAWHAAQSTVWRLKDSTIRASRWGSRCKPELLLRDIFGPQPFSLPPVEPAWLLWGGGTVKRLAEAVYQGRSLPDGLLDPSRLAVLADALEDASCADAELLDHCRSPGPHVRGCWAVDLLTGRE
jgi:hypothetical protein